MFCRSRSRSPDRGRRRRTKRPQASHLIEPIVTELKTKRFPSLQSPRLGFEISRLVHKRLAQQYADGKQLDLSGESCRHITLEGIRELSKEFVDATFVFLPSKLTANDVNDVKDWFPQATPSNPNACILRGVSGPAFYRLQEKFDEKQSLDLMGPDFQSQLDDLALEELAKVFPTAEAIYHHDQEQESPQKLIKSGASEGQSTWYGAVMADNGCTYCVPHGGCTGVLKITPGKSKSKVIEPRSGEIKTTDSWRGAALGKDGKIVSHPRSQ